MTDPIGVYIILGTIVAAMTALGVWDWLAERERLRKRDRDHPA